ncbi:hypothetical protein LCGC14_1202220 [marine sediment metagenome]|uniref:Uncharacterized protein n=1 Tax=marine sediment metagenome TaxID=412755 RepID=A0A0F9PL91_9ZZZZ
MIKLRKFQERKFRVEEIIPYDLDALYLDDELIGFNYFKKTLVVANFPELKGYNYVVDDWILNPEKSKPAKLFQRIKQND